jgi:hypothetical protein
MKFGILFCAALILMAATGVPAGAVEPYGTGIDGDWQGPMRQYDWTATEDFQARYSIDGDRGTSDYPSLNCGGNLVKIAKWGEYTVFTEIITRGRYSSFSQEGCLNGVVTITRVNQANRPPKLMVGWYGVQDGVETSAMGRLEPVTVSK